MTAYSRFISSEMNPARQTPDLLLDSWGLIESFGRVSRRLLWDNEPGIGQRPGIERLVERRNGFFETSFVPGREFISPADFNAQSADCVDRAN